VSTERIAITTGEFARRLNVPIHRVKHAVRSRNIQPNSTAGKLRIFDVAAIDKVAAILLETDSKREEVRS
jgi:hypothetical protein